MGRWSAKAEAENIAWLRSEVTAAAQAAGLASQRVEDVRLALSEAVTNVVQHAYPGRAPGVVGVETRQETGVFVVEVDDVGVGLSRRRADRQPQFGMSLIGALCDVDFGPPSDRGFRVTMRFAC